MTLMKVKADVSNRAILTADSIRSYKYADCRVNPDPDETNGLKGVIENESVKLQFSTNLQQGNTLAVPKMSPFNL
jgi:hypothetical protein